MKHKERKKIHKICTISYLALHINARYKQAVITIIDKSLKVFSMKEVKKLS